MQPATRLCEMRSSNPIARIDFHSGREGDMTRWRRVLTFCQSSFQHQSMPRPHPVVDNAMERAEDGTSEQKKKTPLSSDPCLSHMLTSQGMRVSHDESFVVSTFTQIGLSIRDLCDNRSFTLFKRLKLELLVDVAHPSFRLTRWWKGNSTCRVFT